MNIETTFEGKSIFLTGGTGFLGKAIIEKLLRDCPQIEKIYVLIRPRKDMEPIVRLEKDIIQSPIFDRLRKELGLLTFHSFIHSKLQVISGDVTTRMLGISLIDQQCLQSHVQITIHSAATVKFNERLDIAVDRNCMGALHMLRFVQSLPLLQCHCQVSTAYVNSNQPSGYVEERLYPLDFDLNQMIETIVKTPCDQIDTNKLIGNYPNTYTFTKSMAEHLLIQHQQHAPLVLYRPTIIGAAWKEPMPGWVDQIAGTGAIFLAIGKGSLSLMPGNPRNITDIIPVDLAVNTLLLACCARIHEKEQPVMIVHAGTSDPRQNPIPYHISTSIATAYFQKNPPSNAIFPSKLHVIPSRQQFQLQWFLSYTLPSTLYSLLANSILNTYHRTQAAHLASITKKMATMIQVFTPFLENEWIFETNMISQVESTSKWWFDTKEIVWERYIYNYCVGIRKYVLQEDVREEKIQDVEKILTSHNDSQPKFLSYL